MKTKVANEIMHRLNKAVQIIRDRQRLGNPLLMPSREYEKIKKLIIEASLFV